MNTARSGQPSVIAPTTIPQLAPPSPSAEPAFFEARLTTWSLAAGPVSWFDSEGRWALVATVPIDYTLWA